MGNNANHNGLTESQIRRIRGVATQAFLYVAAFIVTFSLPAIVSYMTGVNVIHANDEDRYYPLILTAAILYPLQGFFNVFIYIRPTYMRSRRNIPRLPRFASFKKAFAIKNKTQQHHAGTEEGGPYRTNENSNGTNQHQHDNDIDGQHNHRQQPVSIVTASTAL